MKAPEPNFTSSTSALQPGGELLRQDRGGDQRHRFDRRRHVADGIEALVGRREVGGLADDGAAGLARRPGGTAPSSGWRPIAGNGIELVERAAGVAEAAPGDHRHEAAAGRDDRRQHQRDIVADAAGRMLVEHRPAAVRQSSTSPESRMASVSATRSSHAHAVEEDRHGEGRGLAFGDACRRSGPRRRRRSPRASSAAAVALLADDLLRQQRHGARVLACAAAARLRASASSASRTLRAPKRNVCGVAQPGPMIRRRARDRAPHRQRVRMPPERLEADGLAPP